jgi:hypothetical protein
VTATVTIKYSNMSRSINYIPFITIVFTILQGIVARRVYWGSKACCLHWAHMGR